MAQIKTISAEQYKLERAICDKATAYWQANASYGRGGWSSLSAEKAAHPDYAACSNEMRGRVEQYEILRDLPEVIGAYMTLSREAVASTNLCACRRWTVSTWTGNELGHAYETAKWPVNSAIGSHMSQFTATIGGREYTGRGFGSGCCITLRETAASKRARAIAA